MMTNEEQARWEAAVQYELKKLQTDNERLRAALETIADGFKTGDTPNHIHKLVCETIYQQLGDSK